MNDLVLMYFNIYTSVSVAQLEEASVIDHAVGRSSSGCARLTNNLQQSFNSKLLGLSDRGLNFKALCTTKSS